MSALRRVAALAACVLGACGYRAGFTLPEQRTVGVAIFDNSSKQRDVERELHVALTDSVERIVDAPLVAPSAADYKIDGRVIEYVRRGGIRSKDNVRLETGVRITVFARLIRASREARPENAPVDPADVLRQVTVTDERGYLLDDPIGEVRARELVLHYIADRIVFDLFGDVGSGEPPTH
jgi:hypothetical protein